MNLDHIGKYRVVGTIGKGAMGEVYKAKDPLLNRYVAIKTIAPALASDPDFRKQQAEKVAVLRSRAAAVARECRKPEYADCWDVYPFNSGYFKCLRLKDTDADTVRLRLLDDHGVGTIALGQREIRVAFSCLTEAQIPGVFAAAAKAVRAVRGR
jgi:serine/threonine protein kinase